VPEPLVVRIADLRTAVERVLALAEDLLGPEVAIDGDHYWHVPVTEAFDLANQPQTFTVGQLSDDLAETVHDDHPRVPQEAAHDLSHLIGLLRALELSARA
jgi:hypothetical protein